MLLCEGDNYRAKSHGSANINAHNTHTLKEGEPGRCIKVFTPACTLNVAEHRGKVTPAGHALVARARKSHHPSSSAVIADSCYKSLSPCQCHGSFAVTHCFCVVLLGLAVHRLSNMDELRRAQ